MHMQYRYDPYNKYTRHPVPIKHPPTYLMVMSKVGILSKNTRKTTIPMSSSHRPKVLHVWGHLPAVAELFGRSSEGVLTSAEELMLNRFSETHTQSSRITPCKMNSIGTHTQSSRITPCKMNSIGTHTQSSRITPVR